MLIFPLAWKEMELGEKLEVLLRQRRAMLQFGQWVRVMVYPSRIFSERIFMASDEEDLAAVG